MSIKEKRKTRKDCSIYSDYSELEMRRRRPNLYKMPNEREKINKYFFELSENSDIYRNEIRVKGIDNRISKEIALTSWLAS